MRADRASVLVDCSAIRTADFDFTLNGLSGSGSLNNDVDVRGWVQERGDTPLKFSNKVAGLGVDIELPGVSLAAVDEPPLAE